MAYPHLELRGGGRRVDLLALLAFLSSVMSSFFTPRLGGVGLSGPSPTSATVLLFHGLTYHLLLQGIFFYLISANLNFLPLVPQPIY